MMVWEREIYINILLENLQSQKLESPNSNPFTMFNQ